MKIIKPKVDNYMSILHLEYPQFKIEDELKQNEVRKRLDKLKRDLAEIEVDGETIH